jgi:hypothetical protein
MAESLARAAASRKAGRRMSQANGATKQSSVAGGAIWTHTKTRRHEDTKMLYDRETTSPPFGISRR